MSTCTYNWVPLGFRVKGRRLYLCLQLNLSLGPPAEVQLGTSEMVLRAMLEVVTRLPEHSDRA